MILQSLYHLYQRLSDDPANGLPKAGYSLQNVTFCVLLRPDGSLVDIQDARHEEVEIGKNGKEKKTLRATQMLLPGQAKPSGSGINPCFLWDNTGYMLSYKPIDSKKSAADQEKEKQRTATSFKAFKQRHLDLETTLDDSAFSAVCCFLESWQPERAAEYPVLTATTSGFGVFQITGQTKYVHQLPKIAAWWAAQSSDVPEGEMGFCLIKGSMEPIASLHEPPIKGVAGAQAMGAKIVSFNAAAYESFGKNGPEAGQCRNAPVSEEAAFAYCNALNYLLAGKSQRFRIGDATTIFWTEKPSEAEALVPWMMDARGEPQDTGVRQRLSKVLEKIARGQLGPDDLGDAGTRFYILGLAPNASRLSIRFWHTGQLKELTANLQKHFNHLRIVRQWDEDNAKNPDPLVPSVFQLLRQTARDADGISPLLGGALMRAILLGTRYPDALVNGVMNRIRVNEKKQQGEGTLDNVSYLRAAILKAWLIRNHHQTISIMLDETNTNPGYRLGRLFSVLEKTQQDALPGLNATIRDRFYSSASATPRAVFGRLLRMYPHHLNKAQSEWAGKIGMDKAIKKKNGREILCQEILSPVTNFPAHLNLQGQAFFALGYYHQRKAFFQAKPKEEIATEPVKKAAVQDELDLLPSESDEEDSRPLM